MDYGEVIELNSSPEPVNFERTTRSKRKVLDRAPSKSNAAKGKGKATNFRQDPVPVIELTDSEPEFVPKIASPSRSQDRIPGPSSSKKRRISPQPQALQAKGSGRSWENLPVASSSSSNKRLRHTPLFLSSDEENHPPPPSSTAVHRNQQPTNSDDDFFSNRRTGTQAAIGRDFEGTTSGPQASKEADVRQKPAVDGVQLTPPAPSTPPIPQEAPIIVEDAFPFIEPEPEVEVDPASIALARVLEIVPDVDPEHASGLISINLPTYGDQTVEHVLHTLFEDPTYPKKSNKKGKKRASEVEIEREAKKPRMDYNNLERDVSLNPNYAMLAIDQLVQDYPHIPKPFLRRRLAEHRNLYAPTFFSLRTQEENYTQNPTVARAYIPKKTAGGKGKQRQLVDAEFEAERAWVVGEIGGETRSGDPQGAVDAGDGQQEAGGVQDDDFCEEGEGIECQCCFADYPFTKMVQCPETHLFCSSCVSTYAATKLGSHDANITCMHSSGCILPFPTSELRRILSPKLMELYERIKQQKEVEAALAGEEELEDCPFCDWKVVFEVSKEVDKLFRCGNEEGGCGVVSCRLCKKPDHLPKSCQEAEQDKHLDGRHAIEEAMTQALMRNCPKCKKAFIKEAGCNKMTCPNCKTLSCYVCRKAISGYDHFNQNPNGAQSSAQSKKCLLTDNVEERHANEVKLAAQKAMTEYKQANPDANDDEIRVDIPKSPPKAAQQQNVGMFGPVQPFGLGVGVFDGRAGAGLNHHAMGIQMNQLMNRARAPGVVRAHGRAQGGRRGAGRAGLNQPQVQPAAPQPQPPQPQARFPPPPPPVPQLPPPRRRAPSRRRAEALPPPVAQQPPAPQFQPYVLPAQAPPPRRRGGPVAEEPVPPAVHQPPAQFQGMGIPHMPAGAWPGHAAMANPPPPPPQANQRVLRNRRGVEEFHQYQPQPHVPPGQANNLGVFRVQPHAPFPPQPAFQVPEQHGAAPPRLRWV